MSDERPSRVSPSRSLGTETRQTALTPLEEAIRRQRAATATPAAQRSGGDAAPASVTVSDSFYLGRETDRQPPPIAPGERLAALMAAHPWMQACLDAGETLETVIDFAELAEDIRAKPAPARSKLWGIGDWPAYFGERAAIREYDGGMARAHAEWWAYNDCVRLYLARHPPIARGVACVWCERPIALARFQPIACEDGATGRLHTACADDFRLARIARAMDSLRLLGVGDRRPVVLIPAPSAVIPA